MSTHTKKRIPLKRIVRLLQRHLRQSERGKKQFRQSGDALETAVKLGVPLDTPIQLPDGREFLVRDQFATSNTAFRATMVNRYQVVPVPVRRTAATAAAPVAEKKEARS